MRESLSQLPGEQETSAAADAAGAHHSTQARWERRRQRKDKDRETETTAEQASSKATAAAAPAASRSFEAEALKKSGYVACADDFHAAPLAPVVDAFNEIEFDAAEKVVHAASEPESKKEEDPCPICLEHFDRSSPDGRPRTCRRCGNSFHQACLSEWNRSEQQLKWKEKPWLTPSQLESGSCPTCRSSKGHDKARRWKKG